jgi:hypothetical protein
MPSLSQPPQIITYSKGRMKPPLTPLGTDEGSLPLTPLSTDSGRERDRQDLWERRGWTDIFRKPTL